MPMVSTIMWRPVRLVLVLLALFGLLGQAAVYAMAPQAPAAVAAIEVAAASMDCVGTPAMPMPADDADMPCESITLDCIAQMGCAPPPAVAPKAELAVHPVFYELVSYPARREISLGLTVRPELFPPIA